MKSLLILIDLQQGWRHKTATEQAMLRAIQFCKKFDGDAVHCKFRNDPDSLFYKQLRWKRFTADADTADIPELNDVRLPEYWRDTYSCVTDELLPVLENYNHVYIAGVFTDISVAITAMHIFDRGIPVTVVRDCVATLHGEDVHKAALKSLEHALGKSHVVSSSMIAGRDDHK